MRYKPFSAAISGGRAALLRDVFAAERGGADVRDRSADAAALDGQGGAALLLPVARVPGTQFNRTILA